MKKRRDDEREDERQEKRQDEEREKMKEKRRDNMKRKRDERKDDFYRKMFQNPRTRQMNQLKMFRKRIPVERFIPPFFFESSESDRFFNYSACAVCAIETSGGGLPTTKPCTHCTVTHARRPFLSTRSTRPVNCMRPRCKNHA